jgi:hypothetical protein
MPSRELFEAFEFPRADRGTSECDRSPGGLMNRLARLDDAG